MGIMRNVAPPTILLVFVLAGTGCSGVPPTTFVHPEYNFSYVERVAVVPFENLSNDQGAGARTSRYFVSELLKTEAFEVVEPGEVSRALEKFGVVRTGDLTKQQILELGKELGVQALFLGSVGESTTIRTGTTSSNVVTLDVRLVETDSGVTVWSTTNTEGGRGFWSTLFGTGERSRSEVTRRCVQRTIEALVD
jgi:TolB-like protein